MTSLRRNTRKKKKKMWYKKEKVKMKNLYLSIACRKKEGYDLCEVSVRVSSVTLWTDGTSR